LTSLRFAGVYTPVATPFSAQGELDERGLRSNIEYYLGSRLTGLVVLGSNGEAAQLDDAEADRVIAIAREQVPADRPLLAGAGRESTRATIAAVKRAAARRVDAVMVRTPSFYKPQMTTGVLIRHFTEVADASPVPVLLYNVSMYTGVNLAPEAVETLSRHPNIVGIKESGNDMLHLGDYLSAAEAGFTVLAGAGPTVFNAITQGAHGAVLALAGLVPDQCVTLVAQARDGRIDEARSLQRRLLPLARAIGPVHGVPGLKAALDLMGLAGGLPRPPLRPVGPAAVDALRSLLVEVGVPVRAVEPAGSASRV
jgi:4-hydroxy-2-oxoglutarate aldolase